MEPRLGDGLLEGGVPGKPLLRSSDEYTTPTKFLFTVKSKKMQFQGDPEKTCSPLMWRVFKLNLPSPNAFSLKSADASLKDTRHVWQIVGFRINRDQAMSSAPVKMSAIKPTPSAQSEKPFTYDSPLHQHIIVGCKPALGSYFTWHPLDKTAKKYLLTETVSEIEDGNFIDFGMGNVDKTVFDKADGTNQKTDLYPNTFRWMNKDNLSNPCTMPATIDMSQEETGDRNFVQLSRQQTYMNKNLEVEFELDQQDNGTKTNIDFMVPTGSTISSFNDLFNKNYWLVKSSYPNNGILWDDKCYFTVADTTRGNNIIMRKLSDNEEEEEEEAADKKQYMYTKHVEIYQMECIVRLVQIKLEAQLIQYLSRMNKGLLDKWGMGWSANDTIQNRSSISMVTDIPMEEEKEEETPEITKQLKCVEIEISGNVHEDLKMTEIGRSYHQIYAEDHPVKKVLNAKKPPAKKRK